MNKSYEKLINEYVGFLEAKSIDRETQIQLLEWVQKFEQHAHVTNLEILQRTMKDD